MRQQSAKVSFAMKRFCRISVCRRSVSNRVISLSKSSKTSTVDFFFREKIEPILFHSCQLGAFAGKKKDQFLRDLCLAVALIHCWLQKLRFTKGEELESFFRELIVERSG